MLVSLLFLILATFSLSQTETTPTFSNLTRLSRSHTAELSQCGCNKPIRCTLQRSLPLPSTSGVAYGCTDDRVWRDSCGTDLPLSAGPKGGWASFVPNESGGFAGAPRPGGGKGAASCASGTVVSKQVSGDCSSRFLGIIESTDGWFWTSQSYESTFSGASSGSP